jgi:RNA ligase (TIGR02306 family)
MSEFKTEQRTIRQVYPHSNADNLELAQCEGLTFQFCIRKDEFKSGSEIVYFPIDSVLPSALIDHLNIRNFLSGKEKNRIRTVKLRNEISQGFVTSVETIKNYLGLQGKEYNSETLTVDLGIEKYEPPEILFKGANLKVLPSFLKTYDIEGADRYPEIAAMLMDQPCFITEKLEGMNFGISITSNDQIIVNQRNFSIECIDEHEEHTFWKVSRNQGLIDLIREIKIKNYPDSSNVTLRGEIVGPGIQGNYYNLKTHRIFLFDIEVNGQSLSSDIFNDNIDFKVPVLSFGITLREWLAGKTIQEASNGTSCLIDKMREGIVIKPLVESYVDKFGRLFIKQRSPEYLAKTGN